MANKTILDFIICFTPEPVMDFFSKGQIRTVKAKRHIAFSFFYRGLDLALGFLQVPLVLNYLSEEEYGIWLVLFSITEGLGFLDVGLEKGLRNKFAEALAKNEKEDAKFYISTTYATVSLIAVSFYFLFVIVNPLLNWPILLNTSPSLKGELSILAIFIFGSFAITLVLRIIITMLIADQRPSIRNLNGLFARLLKLGFLVFLIFTTKSSLLKLGIMNSIAPVITLLLLSLYYFSKDYSEYRPSISYVDFAYLKEVTNLGINFFIISIAGVILFTSDNLIITQLYGPEQVTPYQIAHKYFGLILTFFMIIVQPLWSAITDAYYLRDYKWIKKTIKTMQRVWGFAVVGIFLMLIISPFVYKIWIGERTAIPILLSVSWAIFAIVQMYYAILAHFINGVGKLRIQLILSIASVIINIPLSVLLAKVMGLGTSGIINATSISLLINILFFTIQYNKIINEKDIGIWGR